MEIFTTNSQTRALPVSLSFFLSLSCKLAGCAQFLKRSRWSRADTAGHGVGIFLLDYYTMFDEFGSGWRHLAPYGGEAGSPQPAASSPRNRPEAGKTPAKRSSSFSLSPSPLVDGNLGYTFTLIFISMSGPHPGSLRNIGR